jgi:hypothetical protein
MAVDVVTLTTNMQRTVVDLSVAGAHDAGAGAPIAAVLATEHFGASPFIAGRNVFIEADGPISTGVVKFQTAPKVDPATQTKPVTGSALWVDVVTLNLATARAEATLPADAYWWRYNVTTAVALVIGFNVIGIK